MKLLALVAIANLIVVVGWLLMGAIWLGVVLMAALIIMLSVGLMLDALRPEDYQPKQGLSGKDKE